MSASVFPAHEIAFQRTRGASIHAARACMKLSKTAHREPWNFAIKCYRGGARDSRNRKVASDEKHQGELWRSMRWRTLKRPQSLALRYPARAGGRTGGGGRARDQGRA